MADWTRLISPLSAFNSKSFWLGYLPSILTFLDFVVDAFTKADSNPVATSIAFILHPIFGWTEQEIRGWMLAVAPLYTVIVFHLRKGGNGAIPRPLYFNPKNAPPATIVGDVGEAYAAGKVVGKLTK